MCFRTFHFHLVASGNSLRILWAFVAELRSDRKGLGVFGIAHATSYGDIELYAMRILVLRRNE